MKLRDITGQVFGNMRVLERVSEKSAKPKWLCECICGSGVRRIIRTDSLRAGDSVSCGCLNKTRLRPFEALYKRLIRDNSGVQRMLDIDLTYEQFLEFTNIDKCVYCHFPIIWKMYHSSGYGYNLDRKDSRQGYSVKNLVVCCKRCNLGKRDMFTFDEWYGMTAYFRKETS